MIIRPANDDGVQSVDNVLLCPCFLPFDHVTDLSSDLLNRLIRWLYKEFSLVFTEFPSYKVKDAVDMSDMSLLLRYTQHRHKLRFFYWQNQTDTTHKQGLSAVLTLRFQRFEKAQVVAV